MKLTQVTLSQAKYWMNKRFRNKVTNQNGLQVADIQDEIVTYRSGLTEILPKLYISGKI